jgi:uncharacterized protein YbaR (Trm112 family)
VTKEQFSNLAHAHMEVLMCPVCGAVREIVVDEQDKENSIPYLLCPRWKKHGG